MLEGPDRPLFPEGVPMGLGMAMLQYPGAMEKYGAMEEEAQRQLIEGAKGIPTKCSTMWCVSSPAAYSGTPEPPWTLVTL